MATFNVDWLRLRKLKLLDASHLGVKRAVLVEFEPSTARRTHVEGKAVALRHELKTGGGGCEQSNTIPLHVHLLMDMTANDQPNTGIGIDEGQLDRLFKEFAQGDTSATRRYGGTGLGLVISQRLCNILGGDIHVTSELGVGTRFVVRLPLAFAG